MAQRSTGVFPREKFDLDASMEVTTTPTPAAVALASVGTIRVILLGATIGMGDSVTVTVGGKEVVFEDGDLDANGVGLAYLRGSLCNNNNVSYALDGATVSGVYLDAVDNVG